MMTAGPDRLARSGTSRGPERANLTAVAAVERA